jgi:hypothetical protein
VTVAHVEVTRHSLGLKARLCSGARDLLQVQILKRGVCWISTQVWLSHSHKTRICAAKTLQLFCITFPVFFILGIQSVPKELDQGLVAT